MMRSTTKRHGRSKFGIAAALVIAVTLAFGAVPCYAAEAGETGEAAAEPAYVAEKYSGSKDVTIELGDSKGKVKFRLYYTWQEGIEGHFTGVAYLNENLPEGVEYLTTQVSGLESSYVTLTVYYNYNKILHTVSDIYYVDEYGQVS